MNAWQTLRQLKYLLASQSWGSSGNTVFGTGSVKITAGPTEAAKALIRAPFCLLNPGNAEVDPEHGQEPNLLRQSFTATLVAAVPGDHVGENPLIGGNVPDNTLSEGRGLMELEEELFNAIEYLGRDDGIVIQHSSSSAARPLVDPQLGYVVLRDYVFDSWVTADRFYHACTNFSATGGSGQVSLSWAVPPDRYDRYRVILRRASGASAPTSITDGTGVALADDLSTSVTDTGLAVGTYSYALFATYDELDGRPEGTPDSDSRVSASVTQTSISVT